MQRFLKRINQMRKLFYIALFITTLVACEDREPDPIVTPAWLESRITEIEETGCEGCSVRRYRYKEEYFYHVYCNYWSCYDCEIYRYDGTPVDWEVIDHQDFEENKTRSVLLWECNMNEAEE